MVVATSVEDLCLDDILFDMEEPERTLTLEKWVALEQTLDEGINLRCVDGKTGKTIAKKVAFRGRVYNIGNPNGKDFQRRLAIQLLVAYGRKGKYRKKHQETGLYSLGQMRELTPTQQEEWKSKGGIKIEDWYLTHNVKTQDDEEATAA